ALGGKISATGDVDYSEVRASSLARFWRDVLGLVAELALEPKLRPDEVDREREWLLSRVQKRRDNAPSRAVDAFYAALYGSHPYALPVLGTPESLARIDHAAIAAAYRAGYRPERMVLAVSGQVAASEVLGKARRLFGGMARGGAAADPPIPEPVSADELARAKGYLLGRYVMDRLSNKRLAWYLAFYEIEGQARDLPERYQRAVEAVSVADVLRVARQYLGVLTTLVVRAR